ncbi:unnamed protein product [Linum trigynum]|uniref:RING-type domain-containing protein n=1 Tax=Linum trigynum TaxID=586398 RepID=A0AAV2F4C6_9ROSI
MSDAAESPDLKNRHSDLASGLSGPLIFLIVFACVVVLGLGCWLVYHFFLRQQQQQVQGGDLNPDPAGVAAELELVSSSEERSFADVAMGSRASPDCPICLEQFGQSETVFVLPTCQHVFHRACVAGWVVQRRRTGPLTCPLCRQGLEIAAPAAT